MIRRIASNLVYINEIEFHKNHIVELYNHILVNHFKLQDELAMTEWFSGTIIIYERKAFLVQKILTGDDVKYLYEEIKVFCEETEEMDEELSSSPELSTYNSSRYGNIKRL